jgi:hypothetical protein
MNLDDTSLQAFLEDEDDHNSYKSGLQWSLWWQLTLENTEQGMPEVGEKVITLVNGHGGMGANTRTISKIDDHWIYLEQDNTDQKSLVEKSKWYRFIVRADHETNIDLTPYRGKFHRLVSHIAVGR